MSAFGISESWVKDVLWPMVSLLAAADLKRRSRICKTEEPEFCHFVPEVFSFTCDKSSAKARMRLRKVRPLTSQRKLVFR